ncbi:MAG: DsbC family protein [Gammaproteobacteria bacterium]|nr:MAG: DsbC family protein [Gammaproteobacteria bacterium]
MNRFFVQPGLALAAALLLLAQPAPAASDTEELAAVRARVGGLFAGISPDQIAKSPVDGWYTVRKGAIVAYISADGRYLLQGDLIDLERQVNLSEKSRNQSRVELLATVSADEMIIFAPPVTRYTVTVFTDIDCTYCRRLHSQIDDYLAQGIEIHYLLYPRSGPDTPSWTKAEQVWCAEDRKQALTEAKLDRTFPTSDCDASIVARHYKMGQDIGLRGTPAIVLPDGTLLSGYLPPLQLAQALATSGS